MNKSEIEDWLKKYGITKYTIHPNLVVDVDGGVDVRGIRLTAFPFQFGTVIGDFYCFGNTELPSLQYCPKTVGGDFYCFNNKLTSLKYCPTTVGGDLYCHKNPFKVKPEDYASWIKAIKVSPNVYPQIEKQATPQMIAMHKAMWEV